MREEVALAGGRRISAIRWGEGKPEYILLHGGTQNAHTWDDVALALGAPALAVDLPGHGHSGWRDDGAYHPEPVAADLAAALEAFGAGPSVIVGMSMGGFAGLVVASRTPVLASRLVLVDITPGHRMSHGSATAFFATRRFATLDDMVAHASILSGRADETARRTIWHNARRRDDGWWEWRHHLAHGAGVDADYAPLWEDISALRVPLMLVRGGRSAMVAEDHVKELRARQPGARIEVVGGAGHSVQRSHPADLAGLLVAFSAGGR